MNNKGQVLVLFVLIIPIIFLLTVLIYDIGTLTYTNKKVEDNIEDTMKYAIENSSKTYLEYEVKNLLSENLTGSIIDYDNDGNIITIKVIYEAKTIFLKNYNTITKTYKGYINSKRIEKEV